MFPPVAGLFEAAHKAAGPQPVGVVYCIPDSRQRQITGLCARFRVDLGPQVRATAAYAARQGLAASGAAGGINGGGRSTAVKTTQAVVVQAYGRFEVRRLGCLDDPVEESLVILGFLFDRSQGVA